MERGAERAEALGAEDEASRLWLRALRTANRLGDTRAVARIQARMAPNLAAAEAPAEAPAASETSPEPGSAE